MKKYTVSNTIDLLFVTTIVFSISLVWIRFFIHDTTLLILLCCTITFAISFAYLLYTFKRNKKHFESAHHKKILSAYSNMFLTNTNLQNINFFCKILCQNFLVYPKSNYFLLKDIAVFPLFNNTEINQENVIKCLKTCKAKNIKKIAIFCINYSPTIAKFCDSFVNYSIELLNINNLYEQLLVKYPETAPKIEEKINKKNNKKQLFSLIFDRKKAKSYFIFGLFFFFSAFIFRYNIYYLIFTTISFCFALICLFFGKNKKTKKMFEII